MLRDWGIWDNEFRAMTHKMRMQLLAHLGAGKSDYDCVPIQGSGSYCVAAMLESFVPKDGKVLILANGAYGLRATQTMEYLDRAFTLMNKGDYLPPRGDEVAAILAEDPAITKNVVANDRIYATPVTCAIAICLDGCEPEYLEKAIADGLMPTLKRMRETGTDRLAHSVIPSFTNPNNLSIATGRPPAVHGICGNYLYEPETGEEVMMNDVRFLRAPTVFSKFYEAGARVAIVTAKDKLRALLGAGLEFDDDRAKCFSAERSDTSTKAEHGQEAASKWLGMAQPEVYSAELSEFVFAAGVKLLKEWKPDVMYLTTSDYVQHKYSPDQPEAKSFYEMFDKYLTELDAMGAAIVVTADHGMKPKHDANGDPQVIYVQDLLDEWLGEAAARVILPITDPYVVHHGALGGFGTAYLPEDSDHADIIACLAACPGILEVMDKAEAVRRFELPGDRIGDIVMISTENMTIGTSAHRHDLAALNEPLRSHGGLTEQEVPFICNRVLDLPSAPVLRNFDAFFYATQAAALEKVEA